MKKFRYIPVSIFVSLTTIPACFVITVFSLIDELSKSNFGSFNRLRHKTRLLCILSKKFHQKFTNLSDEGDGKTLLEIADSILCLNLFQGHRKCQKIGTQNSNHHFVARKFRQKNPPKKTYYTRFRGSLFGTFFWSFIQFKIAFCRVFLRHLKF